MSKIVKDGANVVKGERLSKRRGVTPDITGRTQFQLSDDARQSAIEKTSHGSCQVGIREL